MKSKSEFERGSKWNFPCLCRLGLLYLCDVCKIPEVLFVGLFPLNSSFSIYPSFFFFPPPVLLPPINLIFLLPVFHVQIVREEEWGREEWGRKREEGKNTLFSTWYYQIFYFSLLTIILFFPTSEHSHTLFLSLPYSLSLTPSLIRSCRYYS